MAAQNIYERIRENFPDMTELELELEFLIQMWTAALEEEVFIYADSTDDQIRYHFYGINSEAEPAGERIGAKQFFSESLSLVLINSIKRGYVTVFDKTGDDDYIFLNRHQDVPTGDLFLNYTMTQPEAIRFVHGLAQEVD